MNIPRKYILTAGIVLLAVAVVFLKYWDYLLNPWTRDGQVRAEVIQITPRVSGPIVELAVKDNQFVTAGQLLFAIDSRTYKASLDQAQAQYDKTDDSYLAQRKQVEAAQAQVEVARAAIAQAQSSIAKADAQIAKDKAEFERQQELLPQRATSKKSVERAEASYDVAIEQRKASLASLAQTRASLVQAEADLARTQASLGAAGDANASIREARAALKQAELNFEFTRITAPVDGYVTNLNLQIGSQAVTNQPALALVDSNSFWIDGYFKETSIGHVRNGHKAIVTLMTYPDTPIEGRVDSIGWGIAQQDGSTGFELLPTVNPTFEWIRLAQRVPVRIHLENLPKDVALRVGTTGSVLIITNQLDSEDDTAEHEMVDDAAPSSLQ